MKAPDKIYLQIGDDVLSEEFDQLNTEGITWSAVKIHENDLQFISAEKVKELIKLYKLAILALGKEHTRSMVYSLVLTDLTALIEGE